MSALTPTRRSVVHAAAWSVPAVSVAAMSPAFAGSTPPAPAPDLSTSSSGGTPIRTGTQVEIAASTIINTGDATVTGLVVRFESSEPVTDFELLVFGNPFPYASLGITLSPTPSAANPVNAFSMTIPDGTSLGQVRVLPGASWTSPANQRLTFGSTTPTTLTVTATASNGGVAFNAPVTTV
ncbi:hypothetical protein [Nocardioides yefusunii]|uniref:Uncharacterized protein n=1 Tax=Nocardioides yefusunii TaxID=2500546 RepID=A0ABW1QU33_9ACTN|nr:hypothetical protein [Nocardioides yefusunii]